MSREELAVLLDARDKLCAFCENDECEKCQITLLVNDAYAECDEIDEQTDERVILSGGIV